MSPILFLVPLLSSAQWNLAREGHLPLHIIPVLTDMGRWELFHTSHHNGDCDSPILPLSLVQNEWSRYFVDRSDVETFWFCTFWWINIKEMWCFLSLSSKFSFVQKITLFEGGFGERDRTFLIWIKLSLFSRKTFWLWNWILLCVWL